MFHSRGSWSPLKDKRDRDRKRWHFSYWYTFDSNSDIRAQRLFFWDDKHENCGVVLFRGEKSQPYSHIENLVTKLVAQPSLRQEYLRELRFPLERHYAEYGSFPEEQLSQAAIFSDRQN
jgi:hypothetical protein